MQQEKQSIINLPNALTLLRLLLIPVFVILIFRDHMMWALAIFIFASLTDILDGWIARKYSLITDFGKLADPLADKLMVLSVMISLGVKGIAPWAAIIILLSKETLMMLGGLLLLRKKVVVYSLPAGKAAQFVLVLALALCFFSEQFDHMGAPVHLWVLWLGVALAGFSLVYYALRNGAGFFKKPFAGSLSGKTIPGQDKEE